MSDMTNPKTIVITGTSSGFGALTAKALSARGHDVVATMRDTRSRNQARKADLEAFARQGGHKIEVVDLDVTNDTSVSTAMTAISKSHGRIDVLLNNAGVMNIGVTEAYSSEELQTQFEVNTFGPARMIRAVLPVMRAQGTGLIISVTSLAGRVVFPFFGAYGASKFALEALAEPTTMSSQAWVLTRSSSNPARSERPCCPAARLRVISTRSTPMALLERFQTP
jgi:NAD(P)-dependent dehydrogenase (short-subunit alcohol dehydrogenase family)